MEYRPWPTGTAISPELIGGIVRVSRKKPGFFDFDPIKADLACAVSLTTADRPRRFLLYPDQRIRAFLNSDLMQFLTVLPFKYKRHFFHTNHKLGETHETHTYTDHHNNFLALDGICGYLLLDR
jgi:hypothetical protein